eukprot:UN31504
MTNGFCDSNDENAINIHCFGERELPLCDLWDVILPLVSKHKGQECFNTIHNLWDNGLDQKDFNEICYCIENIPETEIVYKSGSCTNWKHNRMTTIYEDIKECAGREETPVRLVTPNESLSLVDDKKE